MVSRDQSIVFILFEALDYFVVEGAAEDRESGLGFLGDGFDALDGDDIIVGDYDQGWDNLLPEEGFGLGAVGAAN